MSEEVILERVTIRNFMSFGNNSTTVELNAATSTLVLGENLDAQSGNGAGKTTIYNAICYALYNKPFDAISLQRLINTRNNIKNTQMEVSLELTKGDVGYEIRRSRGETFNIQILENGEDITLDSVSENDKKIEGIMGMSYDMFTFIVILSGNTNPFLVRPLAAQRLLLDELIGITQLADRANDLRKEIKNTETNIAIEDALVKASIKSAEVYNRQVSDAEARVIQWETSREDKIARLREMQLKYADVDFDQEIADQDSLTDLQTQERKLTRDNTDLKAKIARQQKSIDQMENELQHLSDDKCPYCLQTFADSGAKIADIAAALEAAIENQEAAKLDLAEHEAILSSITQQISTLKARLKFTSKTDAVSVRGNLSHIDAQIAEAEASTNPHIDAFDALVADTQLATVDYTKINELKSTLDHQKVLLKLLVDKNSFIRKRLISKSIPFINSRLMHYSRQIGLPHIIKFNADMECTISEQDKDLDWGNLSSGEKKRVSISLALTFRDAFHHLHFKINGLFVDEIEQSLDVGGIVEVYKVLKNKSRDDAITLWIISHHAEAQGRFDRTVLVRKEAGFSNFIEEPDL